MSFLSKLLGTQEDPREQVRPLWHKIVELTRDPSWYADCKVADTVAGRFDMITAVLSVVVVRLEAQDQHQQSALLCELFVEDMDGQLREFGINDVVVGKHVGRLMSSLGGRLGVYRPALTGSDMDKLTVAVERNVTFMVEGEPTCVAGKLMVLHNRLAGLDNAHVIEANFGLESAK